MENTQESIWTADTYYVAQAMTRGGGFMERLSDALLKADGDNRRKILRTWESDISDLWGFYLRNGGRS